VREEYFKYREQEKQFPDTTKTKISTLFVPCFPCNDEKIICDSLCFLQENNVLIEEVMQ
jgi:hypothetical protein